MYNFRILNGRWCL